MRTATSSIRVFGDRARREQSEADRRREQAEAHRDHHHRAEMQRMHAELLRDRREQRAQDDQRRRAFEHGAEPIISNAETATNGRGPVSRPRSTIASDKCVRDLLDRQCEGYARCRRDDEQNAAGHRRGAHEQAHDRAPGQLAEREAADHERVDDRERGDLRRRGDARRSRPCRSSESSPGRPPRRRSAASSGLRFSNASSRIDARAEVTSRRQPVRRPARPQAPARR